MEFNKSDLLLESMCVDNKGVCYQKLCQDFIMVARVAEKLDDGINGPIHHVNMILPLPGSDNNNANSNQNENIEVDHEIPENLNTKMPKIEIGRAHV